MIDKISIRNYNKSSFKRTPSFGINIELGANLKVLKNAENVSPKFNEKFQFLQKWLLEKQPLNRLVFLDVKNECGKKYFVVRSAFNDSGKDFDSYERVLREQPLKDDVLINNLPVYSLVKFVVKDFQQ